MNLEGEHVNQVSYNVNVKIFIRIYLAAYKNVGYSINSYDAITMK